MPSHTTVIGRRAMVLLAAALLLQGCMSSGAPRTLGKRPNIIFIFSDDHAPHAISAYGSKINQTPNIDRLAREGMLFTNCFCGNSICGPSRATILTGKHCHKNGFMRNGNRFDPAQPTFPKLLQEAGYQTAMIGKWHLTSNPTGFDYWRVLPGQGSYYNPMFITPKGKQQIKGYVTEITTDLALDWVKGQRDPNRPFVLMCQHKAPHRSWMPGPNELAMYRGATIPEPETLFDDYAGRGRAAANQEMEIDRHMYMYYDLKLEPTAQEQKTLQGPDRTWRQLRARMSEAQLTAWDAAFRPENRAFRATAPKGKDLVRWKYQRYIKNYLRCVAGVDKSVGKIIDYVDADPKLRQNTIIIYCSDQGFYLGDHGWYDKRWMYDKSLRMPFVVRWPGQIPAGKRTTAMTQNIDFAPTFLELAGVPVPDDVQGESLLPILADAEPADWRDAVYYHYYESHAVHMVSAHYGVRTKRHKLMYFYEPENRYWELFDLEHDPEERSNVYDDPAYATVRQQLEQRLAQLRSQYEDTTGNVGDFDYTAGIASVEMLKSGQLIVCANARGAYLLKKPIRSLGGTVTLRTAVQPERAGVSRGMIVVTGGLPRQRLFRAGIDFANARLVILAGMKEVAAAKVFLPAGRVAADLEVVFDTEAHTLTATSCGQTVQTKLPAAWRELSAYGYGLSNSTLEYASIELTTR